MRFGLSFQSGEIERVILVLPSAMSQMGGDLRENVDQGELPAGHSQSQKVA